MGLVSQLEGLFLAAVPTVILLLLFYLFMRWSFFGPIERVLQARTSRTEGARKDAEALRAAAQEKQRAYRDALRKVRAEIFAEQEAARRVVLDERSVAIQQARGRASDEIQTAKMRIAGELAAARADLEASSGQLAEEIARAVLERRPIQHPAGEVQ